MHFSKIKYQLLGFVLIIQCYSVQPMARSRSIPQEELQIQSVRDTSKTSKRSPYYVLVGPNSDGAFRTTVASSAGQPILGAPPRSSVATVEPQPPKIETNVETAKIPRSNNSGSQSVARSSAYMENRHYPGSPGAGITLNVHSPSKEYTDEAGKQWRLDAQNNWCEVRPLTKYEAIRSHEDALNFIQDDQQLVQQYQQTVDNFIEQAVSASAEGAVAEQLASVSQKFELPGLPADAKAHVERHLFGPLIEMQQRLAKLVCNKDGSFNGLNSLRSRQEWASVVAEYQKKYVYKDSKEDFKAAMSRLSQRGFTAFDYIQNFKEYGRLKSVAHKLRFWGKYRLGIDKKQPVIQKSLIEKNVFNQNVQRLSTALKNGDITTATEIHQFYAAQAKQSQDPAHMRQHALIESIYSNYPQQQENAGSSENHIQESAISTLLNIVVGEEKLQALNNDQSVDVAHFQNLQQQIVSQSLDNTSKVYAVVEAVLACDYFSTEALQLLDNIDIIQQKEIRNFSEKLRNGEFGKITSESLGQYFDIALQTFDMPQAEDIKLIFNDPALLSAVEHHLIENLHDAKGFLQELKEDYGAGSSVFQEAHENSQTVNESVSQDFKSKILARKIADSLTLKIIAINRHVDSVQKNSQSAEGSDCVQSHYSTSRIVTQENSSQFRDNRTKQIGGHTENEQNESLRLTPKSTVDNQTSGSSVHISIEFIKQTDAMLSNMKEHPLYDLLAAVRDYIALQFNDAKEQVGALLSESAERHAMQHKLMQEMLQEILNDLQKTKDPLTAFQNAATELTNISADTDQFRQIVDLSGAVYDCAQRGIRTFDSQAYSRFVENVGSRLAEIANRPAKFAGESVRGLADLVNVFADRLALRTPDQRNLYMAKQAELVNNLISQLQHATPEQIHEFTAIAVADYLVFAAAHKAYAMTRTSLAKPTAQSIKPIEAGPVQTGKAKPIVQTTPTQAALNSEGVMVNAKPEIIPERSRPASSVPVVAEETNATVTATQEAKVVKRARQKDALLNEIRKFESKRFQFGNQTFLLDKSKLNHILERHHPLFWNGKSKATQSFFGVKTTVDDIISMVRDVMQQNRELILQKGTNGMYQLIGEVNGKNVVIGIDNGLIGQFYIR